MTDKLIITYSSVWPLARRAIIGISIPPLPWPMTLSLNGSVMINQYTNTLLYTIIHYYTLWYTMIHYDTLWYTMGIFFFARGQICPPRADLPAFFWQDRYFHYWPLLTTDRLSIKGNGNAFPFPDSLMTNDHYWLSGKRKRKRNLFPFWKRKRVSVSRLSYGNELRTEKRFRFRDGNWFPFPFCHLIYGAAPQLRVFR